MISPISICFSTPFAISLTCFHHMPIHPFFFTLTYFNPTPSDHPFHPIQPPISPIPPHLTTYFISSNHPFHLIQPPVPPHPTTQSTLFHPTRPPIPPASGMLLFRTVWKERQYEGMLVEACQEDWSFPK